jgi:hypothetical protein
MSVGNERVRPLNSIPDPSTELDSPKETEEDEKGFRWHRRIGFQFFCLLSFFAPTNWVSLKTLTTPQSRDEAQRSI